jgi:hypothetical protein
MAKKCAIRDFNAFRGYACPNRITIRFWLRGNLNGPPHAWLLRSIRGCLIHFAVRPRAHSRWATPVIFRRNGPAWVYVGFLLSRWFLDFLPRHLPVSPAAFSIGLHAPSFAITSPSTARRPRRRGRAARARPRPRSRLPDAVLRPQGRTCGPLRDRTKRTPAGLRHRRARVLWGSELGGGEPSPLFLNMPAMALSAARRDSGPRAPLNRHGGVLSTTANPTDGL